MLVVTKNMLCSFLIKLKMMHHPGSSNLVLNLVTASIFPSVPVVPDPELHALSPPTMQALCMHVPILALVSTHTHTCIYSITTKLELHLESSPHRSTGSMEPLR